LAEQAGHSNPWRLQGLLGSAVWDADELRNRLRDYVVYELGDRRGVLVVDDSGDLKSS
jgi:SRSO17 transposase